jgi:trehalose 6-phosphate synthase/phosphatase
MFRSLTEKGYTIKIGRGNTAAKYTIASQKEVFPFLRKLVLPVSEPQL